MKWKENKQQWTAGPYKITRKNTLMPGSKPGEVVYVYHCYLDDWYKCQCKTLADAKQVCETYDKTPEEKRLTGIWLQPRPEKK